MVLKLLMVMYMWSRIVVGIISLRLKEKHTNLSTIFWGKCTSPSRKYTYLGIQVDSEVMSISLPEIKLQKLHTELSFFVGTRKATKQQLQHLAGKLPHCSKVVRGGRVFSRRVIDLLRSLPQNNVRITLSIGFRNDLIWRVKFSKHFNGTALILEKTECRLSLYSDASLKGYGFVHGQDWVAGFFDSIQVPGDVL